MVKAKIINKLLEYWQKMPNLQKTRIIKPAAIKNLNKVLKYYKPNEIAKAIYNYNQIINDKKYFINYSNSFNDFFLRRVQKEDIFIKYLDENNPFINLRSNNEY
jgi:hypothetical protein